MNDNSKPTTTSDSKARHRITASEIIAKYQNSTLLEISEETPAVISAEIVLLSAKLHEAASLELNMEQRLSRKWAELRSETETDGQADKRIKATDEYADFKIAQINSKTVIEVIRALKKLLQNKSDEYKSGGGGY